MSLDWLLKKNHGRVLPVRQYHYEQLPPKNTIFRDIRSYRNILKKLLVGPMSHWFEQSIPSLEMILKEETVDSRTWIEIESMITGKWTDQIKLLQPRILQIINTFPHPDEKKHLWAFAQSFLNSYLKQAIRGWKDRYRTIKRVCPLPSGEEKNSDETTFTISTSEQCKATQNAVCMRVSFMDWKDSKTLRFWTDVFPRIRTKDKWKVRFYIEGDRNSYPSGQNIPSHIEVYKYNDIEHDVSSISPLHALTDPSLAIVIIGKFSAPIFPEDMNLAEKRASESTEMSIFAYTEIWWLGHNRLKSYGVTIQNGSNKLLWGTDILGVDALRVQGLTWVRKDRVPWSFDDIICEHNWFLTDNGRDTSNASKVLTTLVHRVKLSRPLVEVHLKKDRALSFYNENQSGLLSVLTELPVYKTVKTLAEKALSSVAEEMKKYPVQWMLGPDVRKSPSSISSNSNKMDNLKLWAKRNGVQEYSDIYPKSLKSFLLFNENTAHAFSVTHKEVLGELPADNRLKKHTNGIFLVEMYLEPIDSLNDPSLPLFAQYVNDWNSEFKPVVVVSQAFVDTHLPQLNWFFHEYVSHSDSQRMVTDELHNLIHEPMGWNLTKREDWRSPACWFKTYLFQTAAQPRPDNSLYGAKVTFITKDGQEDQLQTTLREAFYQKVSGESGNEVSSQSAGRRPSPLRKLSLLSRMFL